MAITASNNNDNVQSSSHEQWKNKVLKAASVIFLRWNPTYDLCLVIRLHKNTSVLTTRGNKMQIIVQCKVTAVYAWTLQVMTFSILSQLSPRPSNFSSEVGEGVYSHESVQDSLFYLLHPNIPLTIVTQHHLKMLESLQCGQIRICYRICHFEYGRLIPKLVR